MSERGVAIVTEAAAFGGSVVHTMGLIEALVRRGVPVEVVANRFDPYAAWASQRGLGSRVRVVATNLPGITPEQPTDVPAWEAVLDRLESDVLIFPKGHHFHGRVELLRLFRRRFRTVCFIEHLEAPPKPPWPNRPWWDLRPRLGLRWQGRRRRQRRAAGMADVIVAVSAKVRDRLVEDYDFPAESIAVVRNGVRWREFLHDPAAGARFRAAHGLAPQAFVFGMMTRLTAVKGIDVAIEAMRLAVEPASGRDVALVIAGEGPDRDALESRAERLGLGASVRFVGAVSNPHEALSAFDVILFSSRVEGLPLALLEGMAAGDLPIVTDVGGMSEALGSGIGWLVPPEDPPRLAIAMRAAAALAPEEARAMRERGEAWIRAEFDGDACYEHIVDLVVGAARVDATP